MRTKRATNCAIAPGDCLETIAPSRGRFEIERGSAGGSAAAEDGVQVEGAVVDLADDPHARVHALDGLHDRRGSRAGDDGGVLLRDRDRAQQHRRGHARLRLGDGGRLALELRAGSHAPQLGGGVHRRHRGGCHGARRQVQRLRERLRRPALAQRLLHREVVLGVVVQRGRRRRGRDERDGRRHGVRRAGQAAQHPEGGYGDRDGPGGQQPRAGREQQRSAGGDAHQSGDQQEGAEGAGTAQPATALGREHGARVQRRELACPLGRCRTGRAFQRDGVGGGALGLLRGLAALLRDGLLAAGVGGGLRARGGQTPLLRSAKDTLLLRDRLGGTTMERPNRSTGFLSGA